MRCCKARISGRPGGTPSRTRAGDIGLYSNICSSLSTSTDSRQETMAKEGLRFSHERQRKAFPSKSTRLGLDGRSRRDLEHAVHADAELGLRFLSGSLAKDAVFLQLHFAELTICHTIIATKSKPVAIGATLGFKECPSRKNGSDSTHAFPPPPEEKNKRWSLFND